MSQAHLLAPNPVILPDIRLIHGDCLEEMPKLEAGSVAMVFADLPYGQRRGSMTANDWDETLDLEDFWSKLRLVRASHSATALTAKMTFAARLLLSNPREFRHDLVYLKSRPTRHHHAHRMPLNAHEHVLVFAAKQPTYNPQMTLRDVVASHGGAAVRSKNYTTEPNLHTLHGKQYTHRHPTTALQIKSENGALHPTQKPVALLEWLIKTYTNPGDLVLDPTAGSMTTAVAALRTGRRCICIEKDPDYFRIGSERVAAEQQRLTQGLPL